MADLHGCVLLLSVLFEMLMAAKKRGEGVQKLTAKCRQEN